MDGDSSDDRKDRYEIRTRSRGGEQPPAEESGKLRLVLILAGVVAVVGAVAGFFWWRAHTRVSAVSARVNAAVVPVAPELAGRLAQLHVRTLEHVEKGQLLACLEDSRYRALLEAAAAEKSIKESALAGARAALKKTAGAIEAEIEQARATVEVPRAHAEEARATLELRRVRQEQDVREAHAHCAEARAGLEKLKKGPRKEEIQAAEARLEAARAQMRLAELEVEQSRQLVAEGIDSDYILQVRKTTLATRKQAVREAELELQKLKAGPTAEEIQAAEEALRAREAALARAEAGEQELAVLQARLAMREAELQEARASLARAEARRAELALAEADVETARAELRKAEAQLQARRTELQATSIRSPVTGIVTRTYHDPGEYLSPGKPTILVRDQSRELWIDAYVRQQDRHLVGPGQRARVKVLAGSQDYVEAVVSKVSEHSRSEEAIGAPAGPGADLWGTRFWVKLKPLEPLEPGLKDGMTAKAYIYIRGAGQATAKR